MTTADLTWALMAGILGGLSTVAAGVVLAGSRIALSKVRRHAFVSMYRDAGVSGLLKYYLFERHPNMVA
jgi:hypothetical protein